MNKKIRSRIFGALILILCVSGQVVAQGGVKQKQLPKIYKTFAPNIPLGKRMFFFLPESIRPSKIAVRVGVGLDISTEVAFLKRKGITQKNFTAHIPFISDFIEYRVRAAWKNKSQYAGFLKKNIILGLSGWWNKSVMPRSFGSFRPCEVKVGGSVIGVENPELIGVAKVTFDKDIWDGVGLSKVKQACPSKTSVKVKVVAGDKKDKQGSCLKAAVEWDESIWPTRIAQAVRPCVGASLKYDATKNLGIAEISVQLKKFAKKTGFSCLLPKIQVKGNSQGDCFLGFWMSNEAGKNSIGRDFTIHGKDQEE